MSKERQFQFDSITMAGGTSISPSVVEFDKRVLYIGKNWSIKLKDLNRVNIQEQDNDDFNAGQARRYNRFGGSANMQQRRHGAREGGGSTTVMTLQGKGKSFTCTTTNDNIDDFDGFSEALKQMHRKVKMKNNEKDPYAAADSSNNNVKKSKTSWITPNHSRSNQQQQQQQQSRSSLHLTPQKIKQSSGAFLSSNRANNENNEARNNNSTTRGNVLNNNHQTTSSPSLHLPPKSPRNATPTKLRPRHDSEEEEDEIEEQRRPSSRVLFHEDVGQREKKRAKVNKLQRKIEQKLLDERSDEEEEQDDDVEMEQSEEEEEEEKSVPAKKRRLRKVAKYEDDDESDGSDVEFDTVSSPQDDTSSSKWKKNLRLEDDDDDDDEEDEGEENGSPSPAKEEKVVKKNQASGKAITDEDTSRETSPVTTEDVVAAAKNDNDVEEGKSSSTTPEQKPSTKKGPGTLHSFFQPRSTSSTSSSKTKSATSTSPVPPTPVKQKKDFNQFHPSTPSSRASSSFSWRSASSMQVETTPMQKQARWLDNDATSTPKKKVRQSPMYDDSGAYYDHRKTPLGGFETDQEEEEDDIFDVETTPLKTTYQQRHEAPSRRGRFIYGQRGHLGRARISSNYQNESRFSRPLNDVDGNVQDENRYIRRGNQNRPSEADSALGRRGLAARTNNRDLSRRRIGPSKPSLFPALIEDQNDDDDEAEKDDKPKIPGIQNLGNTCYLSASLQTLYSIPQFLHKLYQSYAELSFTKELPLTTALLEVAVTIGALKEEDVPLISPDVARSTLLNSKAANPSALKKQMDVLTDKFAGYEQRDAHEFLGDLVDFLHEELVDSLNADDKDDKPKESDEPKSEDGEEGEEVGATVVTTDLPTDEYFHLKVRVCLKCKSCGYSRSKEELYRHLSIDVGGDDDGESWGVERSLEQFFQAEDRELKCEKCEDGTCATQTMEIISRPKAILLHFKRFIVTQRDNGEMVLRKNKAKIHLKDSLSISSFFSSEEEKPMGLFHLSAVVHHVGNTAYSGHYTTCAKRKLDEESVEEQWVFFDDTVGGRRTINYVTGDETNQKNCYMALYELK